MSKDSKKISKKRNIKLLKQRIDNILDMVDYQDEETYAWRKVALELANQYAWSLYNFERFKDKKLK